MREWNRGFVKLAVTRGEPIVPVAAFGGEESLPVAWTIEALEPLLGSILGLPWCRCRCQAVASDLQGVPTGAACGWQSPSVGAKDERIVA